MDAVKFLETRKRMCNKRKGCGGCPLLDDVRGCLSAASSNRYEEAVRIVEEWAKNNPVKTRQSEFLKVFPRASMHSGVVNICPVTIDTSLQCESEEYKCHDCHSKYWLAEVE